MDNRIDILSMDIDELIEYLESIGEKKFRAKQVYKWLHEKRVVSFYEMTNISKALQDRLEKDCIITKLNEVRRLESQDGTIKFLFELYDHHVVEAVLMSYKHGNSVCISSQVGCRMGCKFCASTIGGLKRHLAASEMLGQIYEINRLTGKRISNIVIMGTGEPLDNYDNLIKFIEIINSEEGMNISGRNITVSTCGLIDKINELAEEKLPITLAISLHAPNNKIRKTMMPVANIYDYNQLIQTCKNYVDKTKRRITFEYSLVKGVNDSAQCARELSKVLRGILCHVNLIPVNQVEESDYRHSDRETINTFKNILEKHRIPTTVRRELGSDIDAACGQLRRSYTKENSTQV